MPGMQDSLYLSEERNKNVVSINPKMFDFLLMTLNTNLLNFLSI